MSEPRSRLGGDVPRYVQLAEQLRAMILTDNSELQSGFPTEAELCRTYNVSRFTVREALRRLQDEGLIARRRGSGTFVQPGASRGGARRQPFSNVRDILQYARDTQIAWERLAPGRIPKGYTDQLDMNVTGEWHRFRGLRRDKAERAIALTDVFVHRSLKGALQDLDPNRFTLLRQIAEHSGRQVARVTQSIQAVPAPAAVARELGLSARAPSLRVLRCYYDRSDFMFEISVSHHPGDRFAYWMRMDVDG